MRFALLGANGQLGRELALRLPGEVIAPERNRADLTRPAALLETLEEAAPDAVINCAAATWSFARVACMVCTGQAARERTLSKRCCDWRRRVGRCESWRTSFARRRRPPTWPWRWWN